MGGTPPGEESSGTLLFLGPMKTFLGMGFLEDHNLVQTKSQKGRMLYLGREGGGGHIAYTELLSCPTWSDTKQPHKAPVMVAHTTLDSRYSGTIQFRNMQATL